MNNKEHHLAVWEQHPSAFCCFNQDRGTFKVYYRAGECRTALSASFERAADAWADAARGVESKAQAQQVSNAVG